MTGVSEPLPWLSVSYETVSSCEISTMAKKISIISIYPGGICKANFSFTFFFGWLVIPIIVPMSRHYFPRCPIPLHFPFPFIFLLFWFPPSFVFLLPPISPLAACLLESMSPVLSLLTHMTQDHILNSGRDISSVHLIAEFLDTLNISRGDRSDRKCM